MTDQANDPTDREPDYDAPIGDEEPEYMARSGNTITKAVIWRDEDDYNAWCLTLTYADDPTELVDNFLATEETSETDALIQAEQDLAFCADYIVPGLKIEVA